MRLNELAKIIYTFPNKIRTMVKIIYLSQVLTKLITPFIRSIHLALTNYLYYAVVFNLYFWHVSSTRFGL